MALRFLAVLLLLPALAACSDASAEADGRSAAEQAEAAWRAELAGEDALRAELVCADR